MTSELEPGDIFFFLSAACGSRRGPLARGRAAVLRRAASQRSSHVREIVVGIKRLPDAERHERAWAFVTRVSDAADLREELEGRTYQNKTRGDVSSRRHGRPARAGM